MIIIGYSWLPRPLKAGLLLSDDNFMGLTVSAFLTSHFHDIINGKTRKGSVLKVDKPEIRRNSRNNSQKNLDLSFRCRPSFLEPECWGGEYLDLIRSSLFYLHHLHTYPSISASPNPPFPLHWVSIRP